MESLNVAELVADATSNAHLSVCPHDHSTGGCSGATQLELAIAAGVLDRTMPRILAQVSQQLRQTLHAMAAGHVHVGDPDAIGDPEQLLADWFRAWRDTDGMIASELHVRTAAYLTARAVQQGRTVRGFRDL